MKNRECNFKLKSKGPKPPRITLSDVMNSIKELDSKLTARLDKVESRLDNLVSKNNLKE